MEGGRRVFSNIDKIKMFLRGTPTDSGSVGYFSYNLLSVFFGVTASKRELQQNNCVSPQNGHTI